MKKITGDYSLLHRSKLRIQALGEVFTPQIYVEQMIDLLSTADLSDEHVVFFEPTCGHGNIVESILVRRLDALYKKARKERRMKPAFYAVANAINTLWAIDIDFKNVQQCRARVLRSAINFLMQIEHKSIDQVIVSNVEFIAHLICAIIWQVNQNEMFSALSDVHNHKDAKTKYAQKWLKTHAHHPINFGCSWVKHYDECSNDGKKDSVYQWVLLSLRQLTLDKVYKQLDTALEDIVTLAERNVQNDVSRNHVVFVGGI